MKTRVLRRTLVLVTLIGLLGATVVWQTTPAQAQSLQGRGGMGEGPLAGHTLQVAGVHASSVSAVSCSGQGCSHTDPYQTGCANSMYTVDSRNWAQGRVELEYSWVCGTNWAQAYSWNGPRHMMVDVTRTAGPDGPLASEVFESSQYSWLATYQLYSPTNQAAAWACFVYMYGYCGGDGHGTYFGEFLITGYH